MCQEKQHVGEVTMTQKIWLIFKRSFAGKILKRVKHRLEVPHSIKKSSGKPNKSSLLNLQSGDIVNILSREEILKTLDHKKRCEGLLFMGPMWEYCGGTFKVLKRVERIFDEGVIKKMKNTVILDGLICHGAEEFEDCDKSCFFFWKENWLKKANNEKANEQ